MTTLLGQARNYLWPGSQEEPSWSFATDTDPPKKQHHDKIINLVDDDDAPIPLKQKSNSVRAPIQMPAGAQVRQPQHGSEGLGRKRSGGQRSDIGQKRALPITYGSNKDEEGGGKRRKVGSEEGIVEGKAITDCSKAQAMKDKATVPAKHPKTLLQSLDRPVSPPRSTTTASESGSAARTMGKTSSTMNINANGGLSGSSGTATSLNTGSSDQARKTYLQKATKQHVAGRTAQPTTRPKTNGAQPEMVSRTSKQPTAGQRRQDPPDAHRHAVVQPTIKKTLEDVKPSIPSPKSSTTAHMTQTLRKDGTAARPCFVEEDTDDDDVQPVSNTEPVARVKLERTQTPAPILDERALLRARSDNLRQETVMRKAAESGRASSPISVASSVALLVPDIQAHAQESKTSKDPPLRPQTPAAVSARLNDTSIAKATVQIRKGIETNLKRPFEPQVGQGSQPPLSATTRTKPGSSHVQPHTAAHARNASDLPTNAGIVAKQHLQDISRQHPRPTELHDVPGRTVNEGRLKDVQREPAKPQITPSPGANEQQPPASRQRTSQAEQRVTAQLTALKEQERVAEQRRTDILAQQDQARRLDSLRHAEEARDSERLKSEAAVKKRKEHDAAREVEARRQREAKQREARSSWETEQKARREVEAKKQKLQEEARKEAEQRQKMMNGSLAKLMDVPRPVAVVSTVSKSLSGPTTGTESDEAKSAPQPASTRTLPTPSREAEMKGSRRIERQREQNEKRRREEVDHVDELEIAPASPPPSFQPLRKTQPSGTNALQAHGLPTLPDGSHSWMRGNGTSHAHAHAQRHNTMTTGPTSLNSAAGQHRLSQLNESPNKRSNAKLGEIRPGDVWLIRQRALGSSWRELAARARMEIGEIKDRNTLAKWYELVRPAIEGTGSGLTEHLLDSVEHGDIEATRTLNSLVRDAQPVIDGTTTSPSKFQTTPSWDRPRDAKGHFAQKPAPPLVSPFRAAGDTIASALQDTKSFPGNIPTPDGSFDGDYDRRAEGGKTISKDFHQYYMNLMQGLHEQDLTDIERRREPSPFSADDYCHFAYQVCRREISNEEIEDGADIEDLDWTVTDEEYEDMKDANQVAGVQATRFLDARSAKCDMTLGNSITNEYDEHGMQCSTLTLQGGGIVQARVTRYMRTFHDGIHPSHKDHWAPTIVWFLYQKILKKSGDALFDGTHESDVTTLPNNEVFTALDMANKRAASRFVNLTFTPQSVNLRKRDDEVTDEEQRLLHRLDVEDDETFDETFTSEDGSMMIRVWVEQGQLNGPRN